MNIILCLHPMNSSVSCRPNALLMWPEFVQTLYYPKLFPRINNMFELQQNRNQKITQYGCILKGNCLVAFRSTLLVSIFYWSAQKSLSNEYNIVFASDIFFGELPSKCVVQVAWSCVDFVTNKVVSKCQVLITCLSYSRTEIKKSHNMSVY